ncbi:MAG: hypothetical protein WCS20_16050 [Alphaproteobacteria bacterium]|jgi:ElaB/YqjD/DUF883 family membrane-anchored ribosome-binding protein
MATKPKSADDSASDGSGPADTGPDDIQARLAALHGQVAALAAALASLSQSGSDAVKQAAREAYAGLKSQSGDFDAAEARAQQIVAEVADFARKNPLQSLGLATGFGVILGLLLGRR